MQAAINFNESYNTTSCFHSSLPHPPTSHLNSASKNKKTFQGKLDGLHSQLTSAGFNTESKHHGGVTSVGFVSSTKNAGKKGSSLNRQQVNSINNSFSKLHTVKPASSSHKRLRKSTSKSRKRDDHSLSSTAAHHRSGGNLRDKLSGLESNMKAMKDTAAYSDQVLERAFRAHQRQTDAQLETLKDSVMRLAEMMCEEFSTVREELQGEVSKQYTPVMARWSQVETHIAQI